MRREKNNVEMALPFCLLCQLSIILLCQLAGGTSNVKLEHSFPRVGARQRDIDTFLEPRGRIAQGTNHENSHRLPSFDGVIQRPRYVRGPKDKHTGVIVTNAVHLNQKLRLDTSRALRLALATGTSERIDFVDENNGRLVFSRHLE